MLGSAIGTASAEEDRSSEATERLIMIAAKCGIDVIVPSFIDDMPVS